MDADTSRIRLAALGNQTRLAVVEALADAGAEGRLPSDLADEIGIPRNLLSAHLLVLDRAGLVSTEQRGRNRILRLVSSAMIELSERLAELGRAGRPAG